MRNNLRGGYFFIIALLLLTFCAHSQNSYPQRVALSKILPVLEKRFHVRFSYRHQDIQEIEVIRPAGSLRLNQTLKYLSDQTSLNFEILDERYIAISKLDNPVNFCGTVRDANTGELLEGASVYTSDLTFSTVTDKNGKFLFSGILAESDLHIRFLGYNETTIKAENRAGCAEISLLPQIFSLQESVVVNYLTSGISKRKDGSTHINTDRFGALPGQIEPDVLQTIEALPGVESVNETISNLNIRGGTSDQNLVLFDDIKMYLTGHFFGLISAFNPNLTDEVVVTKNGSSAQLNDGVSGTIEIFSENELSGKLSGGAGLNFVSTDAFLRVPVTEKLEFHISGRRSINDYFDTPTYSNYFSRTFQDSEVSLSTDDERIKDSNFYYYDTSLKVLYDLNQEHKLRFSLIKINNDLEYSEFSSASEETRRSSLGQKNLALGGTWQGIWSDIFSTKATGYLTHYRLDAMNYTVDTDQRLLQKNEVLETGFKLNSTTALSPTIDLLSGYQFYEVGVSNIENLNNPFFSSTIKNVLRSQTIFTEAEYSNNSTFLRGGLRLNYLAKFEDFLLEPRLSFNQKLGKKFSFKLLGEFKSQTTSQVIDLQEDFLGVESRRWILADMETYPVIRSKQISAGFDFKAKGWYVDLETYYKVVDGISTSNQGFQDQHEFIRTSGSYTAKGFELLVNKKAGPVNAYLNYTFGNNEYTFEDLSPQTFPNNFDIRHSASMAVSYFHRNFKFSLGGNLRTGKPYTRPVDGNETRREGNNWIVNYGKPNAENLPYFFRIDLSSSYNLVLNHVGNLNIGIGVLNVLDRENIINRYYRVSTNDRQETVEVNNTSLGLTPNASLKFTF